MRLENCELIFYTAWYEDSKQIFFATIVCDFYHAVADFNRVGMDDADYVYDEILAEIRR